jgi:hypothetical protein
MSNVNLSSSEVDISKEDPFEFSTNDPLENFSFSKLLIDVNIGKDSHLIMEIQTPLCHPTMHHNRLVGARDLRTL